MAICPTCHEDYDETHAGAVNLHTEASKCSCKRCNGKPQCYTCTSSFCFCTGGH